MEVRQSPPESQGVRAWQPEELLLRGLRPEEAGQSVDWSSWYLTDEEDMGESVEQGEIIRTMLSSIGQLARERRWMKVYWGGDQFFAWVPNEPLVRVSPDIYLIDDPPSAPMPESWQTWVPGHRPPRLAIEVVSRDRKKDYEVGPFKYSQLGVRELVIFDPNLVHGPKLPQRIPLQLYRRSAAGAFLRVYAGPGPVHSAELDAYLVIRREAGALRLRLARDAAGQDLVPTAEEYALSEAAARRKAEERAAAQEDARRKAEERAAAQEDARHKAEERAAAQEDARRKAEKRAAAQEDARHKAEERAAAQEDARRKAEERVRELEEMLEKLRR